MSVIEEDEAAGEVTAGLEEEDGGGGGRGGVGVGVDDIALRRLWWWWRWRWDAQLRPTWLEEPLQPVIDLCEPAPVLGGEEHGTAKGASPEEVGGVVVRVGDGDGGEAAEGADAGDGGGVEEGEAVPEDVAAARGEAEEGGALAYGELGGGLFCFWGERVWLV